ncbi:phosphoenolpyruvate carboxykinase (ATP) [Clostridium algidicarnis]|uniref:phosphoenolpyruvate carboxykinase (ATP) n=1 Tax=Clostridium algidicarnis TaxID=37659 RepID=UPI001C0BAE3E|nr:phosphoenolpyruvate carboxykinase (ATP) [Clostridium algidicarnis]MBU3206064.1 phosphoenolpyruvate carboxykinase (ATP) [Clostridium algidicarnis]
MGSSSLEYLNLKVKHSYENLPAAKLIEDALKNGEGCLSESGALVVETGKYTGRSPKDRFIVRQKSIEDKINWGDTNLPINEDVFDNLYKKVLDYLEDKDAYIFDGFVGAEEKYKLSVKAVCEYASQALFASQLFRRYDSYDKEFLEKPDFTVISAPGFKADGKKDGINSEAFILVNFDKKIVLIGGTQYAGEIKKSMFSVMNFLLPLKGVFPMHCSANVGENEDVAIFFGLSGTGKTTLSTDPKRKLIGDDEHGWWDEGVFNFEGGCYAKTISLDKDKEKDIYEAIRFGALLENVVLDENRIPNYDDDSLTENTRAAYNLSHIDNIQPGGKGKNPNTIIFLTADAFGVLPPISKLSKEAAMYHFMSGYTSKLAGTERGIKEPQATFSACFGEPFMLMNPAVYAKLLGERIDSNEVDVYLINTGWCGGPYGVGSRMKLPYTRAMVTAAIEGGLKDTKWEEHPIFKVMMPMECKGVPSEILNPINLWEDKESYNEKAIELAKKFNSNFKKFKEVSNDVVKAGPTIE